VEWGMVESSHSPSLERARYSTRSVPFESGRIAQQSDIGHSPEAAVRLCDRRNVARFRGQNIKGDE